CQAFYKAMDEDETGERALRYGRARMVRHDRLAEDVIGLCHDERIPADRLRVMVDSYKWLLSKLAPSKYGDRQQLEVSGGFSLRIDPTFIAPQLEQVVTAERVTDATDAPTE